MRSDFFDYSGYGIHPTLAFLGTAAWLAAIYLVLSSCNPTLLAVSPLLMAYFLISDVFAVFALEQLGYLWRNSFCPWYMVVEFYPPGDYFNELFLHLLIALCSAGGNGFTAALDFAACLMRPWRALFDVIVINGAFFDLCYKVMRGSFVMAAAVLKSSLRLARLLLGFVWSLLLKLFGL